jgi:hypothetical protein
MKSVATYTRKSIKSDQKQSNSHDRQTMAIKLFCADNDYIIIERFTDSESGRGNDRPGWRALIEWLNGSADRIVVMDSVSRMGRNQSVWTDIEKILYQFRFVQTGTQEPTMELVAALLTAATSESNRMSYRVRTTYNLLKKRYGDDLRWGNPNIKMAGQIGANTNEALARNHWDEIFAVEAALYATMPMWNQKKRIERMNIMNYKTRQGKPITRQNLNYAHRRYSTGGVEAVRELLWQNTP